MNVISKLITLEEIEILRDPLEKLHAYHNDISTYFSGSYPRVSFDDRIEEYRQNAQSCEYRIELLFSKANAIIGFCIASKKNKHGKIDVLFVDEENRKHGLGKKLMNNVMNWFTKHKIKDIELTVVYGNEVISFYQKMGFQPSSMILKKL